MAEGAGLKVRALFLFPAGSIPWRSALPRPPSGAGARPPRTGARCESIAYGISCSRPLGTWAAKKTNQTKVPSRARTIVAGRTASSGPSPPLRPVSRR